MAGAGQASDEKEMGGRWCVEFLTYNKNFRFFHDDGQGIQAFFPFIFPQRAAERQQLELFALINPTLVVVRNNII